MKDRTDRSRMSMSDLIREADEREIAGAEWMDRATLVRALEAGEDRPKGILARARRFLGQVTGLDRVVKTSRADVEREWKVGSESAGESEQVLVRVSESERERESENESENESELEPKSQLEADPTPPTPRASDLLAGDPSFGGMRVVSRDGHSWLVWRAPTTRLAAVGGGTDLTLRMVSIHCAIGEPDADVIVETADESGLALEGVRAIPFIAGRQCVAAIGVGRGDGFVAVAHARVA